MYNKYINDMIFPISLLANHNSYKKNYKIKLTNFLYIYIIIHVWITLLKILIIQHVALKIENWRVLKVWIILKQQVGFSWGVNIGLVLSTLPLRFLSHIPIEGFWIFREKGKRKCTISASRYRTVWCSLVVDCLRTYPKGA